jgi:NitT/TauT family transport system ATP-binding protein
MTFQGVTFSWGRKNLLKDFYLSIGPGETVVLVGPSGCGKTTLARLALGLLAPRVGLVCSPRRPAVLFQEDGLLNHRTVLANVLLPAREQKRYGAIAQARELIFLVGLAGEEETYPPQLSGGMKKRVALARALMQEPDFFVLDEPFQSLDEASRGQLWDLVFQVLHAKGIGALIITHYPAELSQRPVQKVLPFPRY